MNSTADLRHVSYPRSWILLPRIASSWGFFGFAALSMMVPTESGVPGRFSNTFRRTSLVRSSSLLDSPGKSFVERVTFWTFHLFNYKERKIFQIKAKLTSRHLEYFVHNLLYTTQSISFELPRALKEIKIQHVREVRRKFTKLISITEVAGGVRCVRSFFDLPLKLQHSGQRQLQILSCVWLLYKHRVQLHAVRCRIRLLLGLPRISNTSPVIQISVRKSVLPRSISSSCRHRFRPPNKVPIARGMLKEERTLKS